MFDLSKRGLFFVRVMKTKFRSVLLNIDVRYEDSILAIVVRSGIM